MTATLTVIVKDYTVKMNFNYMFVSLLFCWCIHFCIGDGAFLKGFFLIA